MRPQQNRRMRGRGNSNTSNNNNNNGNRKGPNPLTRSYESNGPDVKIRGTAQQVAEKYTTLARDAQSSGDRVMAENYLQHAEHYNRIIMAAQVQQQQFQQARETRDFDDRDDGDESDDQSVGERPVQQHVNGSGPQPVIDDMPAEIGLREGGEARPRGRRPEPPRQDGPDAPAEAAAPVAEGSDEQAESAPARKPRRARRSPRRDAKSEDETGEASEPVTEPAQ